MSSAASMVRGTLADAVVGDGNGPVPHAVGQPDDLAGVTEASMELDLVCR